MRKLRLCASAAAAVLSCSAVKAQDAPYVPPLYPVEVFAKQPAISQPELSPDGKSIAYITSTLDGRKSVIAHPITGAKEGETLVLPHKNDADISYFTWANNEILLVSYNFYSANGLYRGLMVQQDRLFAANMYRSEVYNVVKASKAQKRRYRDSRTGFSSNSSFSAKQSKILSLLPDDPEHIVLAIDDNMDGHVDIRKIEVATGDFQRLQGGRKDIDRWLTDKNGHPLLGHSLFTEESKVFIAKEKRDVWSQKAVKKILEQGFTPIELYEESNSVLVQAINDYGRYSLGRYDLTDGKLLEWVYSNPSYDATWISRSVARGKMIGASYTDTAFRQVFLSGLEKIVLASVNNVLPQAFNKILSSSQDGALWLIHSFTQGETPRIYALDRRTQEMSILSDTYGALKDGDVAHITMHKVTMRDGLEIEVYVTTPVGRSGEALPAVILPHSWPWGRDSIRFNPYVQFLANRGYLVLQPNYRGSSGYGQAFADLGKGSWGNTMQEDLSDTAKWAMEEGLVQTDKMCILSGSYTGYAAIMGVVESPELFQCAGSINGVTDLELLKMDQNKFLMKPDIMELIGQDDIDYKAKSPYHRAADILKPVLLIAAKDDWRVNYRHSKNLHKKLKKLRRKTTYLELKSGGPGLDDDAQRIRAFKAIETFLAKHIGGESSVPNGSR